MADELRTEAAYPSPETGSSGFADVETPSAPCTRLLCAAPWTPPGSAVQELLQGRRDWLTRHALGGVRTALLHTSGWLLRWFEGTAFAVEAEWQRLRADPACRQLRVLHCSEGRPLLGPAVQVVSVHGGDSGTAFVRRMQAVEREGAQGLRVDPIDVWHALGAPAAAALPGTVGLIARRDVVVMGSEDNEAVDVIRLLAQVSGDCVVYQRYAGSAPERGDVGAAYVDVSMERSLATRVHALPRRAPGPGCTLLGLRNVQCVVLLLGAHVQRSRVAVLEAMRVMASLPLAPAVVVASRCPDISDAAVAALSQMEGLAVSCTELARPPRASAALLWQLLESGNGAGQWSVRPRG